MAILHRLYLIFNLLLLVFGAEASFQFTKRYEGQIVKSRVHSPVNFTWTFTGNPDSIDWGVKGAGGNDFDKNGLILSLKGGVQTFINKEYVGRVSGNSQSGQVIFTFKAINRNDTKSYLCILRGGFGESDVVDDVELIVEGPPEITIISPNTTVIEGDSVTLNCVAAGHPKAKITWTKDDKVVNFPFNQTDRGDAGAYRCTADNGVGNSATADVFVTVQYPATIENVSSLTSQSWIGQNITIWCEANGVPTPNITWVKPDGTRTSKESVMEHTVNLLMKTDEDFGTFTCVATNGVGTAVNKTVKVKQIKAPGAPNVSVNVQASSITIKWSEPANDGGSSITAYRVAILQGTTHIRNLNITNLSRKEKDIEGLNINTSYIVRVFARNYALEGNAAEKKIRTKFEGVPAAAEIIDLLPETKNTEITIQWNKAVNNGAPITHYSVYQRTVFHNGTSLDWIKEKEIKASSPREFVVKLEKGKDYQFVVTARNKFGEGKKEQGKIKKIKVLGDVPSAVTFTYVVKDGELILEWEEPFSNGATITMYTVYHGTANDENWNNIENVTDVSRRQYILKVAMGNEYKVLITATNKYGESSKKGKVLVDVQGGSKPTTESQTGGLNTAVIAGAAAAGVVLIGLTILAICWKRRKRSPDDTSSPGAALRSDNAYELDDAYHDVSASAAAAWGLQAEAGPVAEPDYAKVDMSKKKRNRRPVTDEYAQVDKSKKSKKPRKPGELDYAELDDFRPSVQPAAAAAAAEAAPARPLIRRPAYEGTEYADITQFGVPQPEPTYGNVPKKDVVYSNVQGI